MRLARFAEHDITEAIGVYLNAKFPYGESTDRWRRRRG
jgi:hypothetical protein